MSVQEKIVILIPSLDPDKKITGVIDNLINIGFNKIVLVDDGSRDENKHFFDEARTNYGCRLLTHCVNLGKGRAIKDGLNYIYTEFPECEGVVTVDGDGQHGAEDTLKVATKLLEEKTKLVMGCRDFSMENVPARSRFGNVTTSRVMKLLCGISLSDTQTGLRGIPMAVIPDFVKISGERFEYELNMILEAKQMDIELCEVQIETIYLEENSSSHFNPLLDSIRIYSIFAKFILSSLSACVVDIALFTVLCGMFKKSMPEFVHYIIAATVIARCISASVNFIINRRTVFSSEESIAKSGVRYAILAGIVCVLSAFLVHLMHGIIGINETFIKIVVDTILFVVNFNVQREWVFKK